MGFQTTASAQALARRLSVLSLLGLVLGVPISAAHAQTLEVNDDRYGIPFGAPLEVEAFGVMENDQVDGENAGEMGATVTLVTDVSYGTLALAPDGSFTYAIGAGFNGTDQFVYRAEIGPVSGEGTVLLSACEGGPEVYTCWNEQAYLDEVQANGYATIFESFEDDVVWGDVRTPSSAPSVVSQGVLWRSNHPDPPASNPISTTSGPPHHGMWAIYDPNHGYATGTPSVCDIDNPPEHCLYHDGVTGIREAGLPALHAVGGYFHGIYGANLGILVDGAAPIGGGHLGTGFEFFGVIDTRPAGFTQFEFRELDGKVGQAFYVWGDEFTMATEVPVSAPQPTSGSEMTPLRVFPNPVAGRTTIAFELRSGGESRVEILDVAGRLVRRLVDGPMGEGRHAIEWDRRDQRGQRIASGVYVLRLTGAASAGTAGSSKVIVLD